MFVKRLVSNFPRESADPLSRQYIWRWRYLRYRVWKSSSSLIEKQLRTATCTMHDHFHATSHHIATACYTSPHLTLGCKPLHFGWATWAYRFGNNFAQTLPKPKLEKVPCASFSWRGAQGKGFLNPTGGGPTTNALVPGSYRASVSGIQIYLKTIVVMT